MEGIREMTTTPMPTATAAASRRSVKSPIPPGPDVVVALLVEEDEDAAPDEASEGCSDAPEVETGRVLLVSVVGESEDDDDDFLETVLDEEEEDEKREGVDELEWPEDLDALVDEAELLTDEELSVEVDVVLLLLLDVELDVLLSVLLLIVLERVVALLLLVELDVRDVDDEVVPVLLLEVDDVLDDDEEEDEVVEPEEIESLPLVIQFTA